MDKIISFKSFSAFYKMEGNGEPVMLVHGFAEDHIIWNSQVDYLKKDFLLIVPDLPGSGRSVFNPQLSTIDDYADVIKFILDEEGISACTIIGHSMGGYITLAFAEKYPDQLNAFGLFHSTTYADSEEKKAIRRKAIEFIRQHGSYEFIKQSLPALFSENFKKKYPGIVAEIIDRYANFNPESLVNYYEAMMNRPDRTNILKNFQGPVLFIAGEQDKAIPLEHCLQQSHIPELSYIHILENAGHMAMLEETAYSNDLLKNFLRQIIH